MSGKSLLLLSGSLRNGSSNTAAINTAATALPAGWCAEIYRGMNDLRHFNPDVEAEGLYAGALPGSIKNLFDWTVGGMETVDKPVAWLGVSSNATQASGAHESLRVVLEYTGVDFVNAACRLTPLARADVDAELVAKPAFIADATAATVAPVRHVEAVK